MQNLTSHYTSPFSRDFGAPMQFLSFQDVADIHACLVEDFNTSNDPISPPGTRDQGQLLASAIGRQEFGMGSTLKYPTRELNAASLCYGICNNHPFHNGNKRTALVTLLCHLDKNSARFCSGVTGDHLYDLMLRIASHDLVRHHNKRGSTHDTDAEVVALAEWIRKHTETIGRKGERVITYRRLRQILRDFGYTFDNYAGNFVDVVRYETKIEGRFLFKKERKVQVRATTIPYPREGAVVGRALLRQVREACKLTEHHGFESDLFYEAETEVDVFIQKYRKTLRRLART